MKTIFAFFFAAFFAGSALAQEHTQNQPAQPQSPPQGWVQQQSGTTANLGHVFFFTKDSGWVLAYSSQMFHTEDGGATWIQSTTLHAQWLPFLFLDYNTGFAYNGDSIIKTIDAGLTWSKPKFAQTSGFIASASVGKDSLFIITNNFVISISTDRGDTWVPRVEGFGTSFPTCIAFADSKHGWVMGNSQLFPPNPNLGSAAGLGITNDGGQTWATVFSGIHNDVAAIYAFDNLNAIASSDYIYRTIDGGLNWVRDTFFNFGAEMFFLNRRIGYGCSGAGRIEATFDSGKSWQLQPTGILNGLTGIVFADTARGWCVGYNGIILHTENGGQSWVKQQIPQPLEVRATPEPFTSKTTLSYSIPKAAKVDVKLYDMLGKEVYHITSDGIQSEGLHSIEISGEHLPGGVYYFILTAGSFNGMGKVTKIVP
jgi:photosystem II stability/assembly factor-like uncharacterized protein